MTGAMSKASFLLKAHQQQKRTSRVPNPRQLTQENPSPSKQEKYVIFIVCGWNIHQDPCPASGSRITGCPIDAHIHPLSAANEAALSSRPFHSTVGGNDGEICLVDFSGWTY
jgi:hypothetical protein